MQHMTKNVTDRLLIKCQKAQLRMEKPSMDCAKLINKCNVLMSERLNCALLVDVELLTTLNYCY